MVYVLSKDGLPLMPTQRHGKVRRLLKNAEAKVVRRTPFTIQLLYDSITFTQPITLGIDAGSKTVGLSATTEAKELFASECALRADVVENLSIRRENRRVRRGRKTRYRKPRFNNRVKSKHKGCLAPSCLQKINTHLQLVKQVHKILPITKIVVEVAQFDIQKIKNPNIQGEEYQQGEQLNFWNLREYVLFRDGHKCQGKKGCKGEILNVHHIETRKTGGDAPNNLVTLCKDCHTAYHEGGLKLNLKRGQSFRDAAFMGIMRWSLYNKLKETYENVSIIYGYETKHRRISNGLEKSHAVDARCVTGNPKAKPIERVYKQKATRVHNRQIHKRKMLKGGVRKLNQVPKYVYGYELFDKVRYKGKELFIWGRRQRGYFLLKSLDDKIKIDGISVKKIKLLERRKAILTA